MCWRGCLPTETLLWQVNKALIRHDLALICERRANDRVYRNQPCFLYHSAVCFSPARVLTCGCQRAAGGRLRSEEHTSELQSLMRISYAVFGLNIHKRYRPSHSSQRNIPL